MCRFAAFTLPATLDSGDRARALKLLIDEASPYQATGFLAEWGLGRAGAWLWDKDAVEAAIEAVGEDANSMHVLPETAVQQQGPDGARLVEVLDGFEAQAWQGGLLRASRYWPQPPDQAEWIRFLRASSDVTILGSAAVDAVSPAWLERPWPRRSVGSVLGEFKGWKVAAAIGCVAVAPFAYQVGQVGSLIHERGRFETRIRAMETEAAPVLAARDAAMRSAARVRQIEALQPFPSPLETMARIAEKLPTNGTIFQDFSYQQGDVRFTLTGQPAFDATFFVRGLSSVPIFTDVNAESSPTPSQLTLRLKLLRQAP